MVSKWELESDLQLAKMELQSAKSRLEVRDRFLESRDKIIANSDRQIEILREIVDRQDDLLEALAELEPEIAKKYQTRDQRAAWDKTWDLEAMQRAIEYRRAKADSERFEAPKKKEATR